MRCFCGYGVGISIWCHGAIEGEEIVNRVTTSKSYINIHRQSTSSREALTSSNAIELHVYRYEV